MEKNYYCFDVVVKKQICVEAKNNKEARQAIQHLCDYTEFASWKEEMETDTYNEQLKQDKVDAYIDYTKVELAAIVSKNKRG